MRETVQNFFLSVSRLKIVEMTYIFYFGKPGTKRYPLPTSEVPSFCQLAAWL